MTTEMSTAVISIVRAGRIAAAARAFGASRIVGQRVPGRSRFVDPHRDFLSSATVGSLGPTANSDRSALPPRLERRRVRPHHRPGGLVASAYVFAPTTQGLDLAIGRRRPEPRWFTPVGRIARRLDLACGLRASGLEGQDEDDLRLPARSMMSRPAQLRGDLRFLAVPSASTKPDKQQYAQCLRNVEAAVLDCLSAMRKPGENYSDAILRLVSKGPVIGALPEGAPQAIGGLPSLAKAVELRRPTIRTSPAIDESMAPSSLRCGVASTAAKAATHRPLHTACRHRRGSARPAARNNSRL